MSDGELAVRLHYAEWARLLDVLEDRAPARPAEQRALADAIRRQLAESLPGIATR